ncbi:MAG: hypothetical protein HY017_25040 [Betaproteobacteria bacterium]|nr:hypothetical protein [Betaproteobacteria bacterium]
MKTEKPRSLVKRIELLERDLGRVSDAEAEVFMDSVTDEELILFSGWLETVSEVSEERTPKEIEAERQRVRQMPTVELNRAIKPSIDYWRRLTRSGGTK